MARRHPQGLHLCDFEAAPERRRSCTRAAPKAADGRERRAPEAAPASGAAYILERARAALERCRGMGAVRLARTAGEEMRSAHWCRRWKPASQCGERGSRASCFKDPEKSLSLHAHMSIRAIAPPWHGAPATSPAPARRWTTRLVASLGRRGTRSTRGVAAQRRS